MATFPTYNSNGNINVRPAGPEQNTAADSFKPLQQVEETLTGITQKLSDANDVMQYTKAKTNADMAIAQQENLAANDPNPDNVEMHLKAIQEVQKNSVKGVSNQMVAGKLQSEISQASLLAGMKIDSIFKKKQMNQNEYKLYDAASTASFNKSNAITEAAGQQVEHDFMNTINANIISGLITPERGHQLVNNYKMGVVQADINKDMATDLDRSKVYKNLTEGKYGELDYKQMNEATNMIHKRVKENVQLGKEIQYQTEASIAQDIANNNYPDVSKLSEQINHGTISPKFAEAVIKATTSPSTVAAETDNEEFSKLTQEIFKSKDKDNVKKVLVNILHGNGNGQLSKDDLGVLINSAMLQGKQNREDIKNTIETLGNWADTSKLNRADIFRSFQKNIQNGDDLPTASNKAMQTTIINKVPGASSLAVPPNYVITKDSNIKYIFPRKTTNQNASNTGN